MIACNECQTPFSVELAKELPVNLALMILITDSIAIFNRKDVLTCPCKFQIRKTYNLRDVELEFKVLSVYTQLAPALPPLLLDPLLYIVMPIARS